MMVNPSALRAIVDPHLEVSTFKFFTNLPVELQLMIWEEAVGKGPTMVVIPHCQGLTDGKVRDKPGKTEWSGAALLSACKDSRKVAIRVWGKNVRHIPSPGVYAPSDHRNDIRVGCTLDLATDALYWRNGSWVCFVKDMTDEVKSSTIAIRYEPEDNRKCGSPMCLGPNTTNEEDCVPCLECLVHTLFARTRYGTSGIRRFMMVVEDFGILLGKRMRATGPVYTTGTPQDSIHPTIPAGTEFYDVTGGLLDVAGENLFKAGEGKLQQLEDAKRALGKAEKRWRKWSSTCSPTRVSATSVEFRILVGVKQ
ncbi:hypothetical protein QBC39DRAFT_434965 [Podospora conica]|nr:hypothetical protein QBC39DRAFT_434965 [Schizothecium conicum]